MKIRYLLLQNIVLFLGIWCIHSFVKFNILGKALQQILEKKPVFADGEGISGEFLGIPLAGLDGIRYTEASAYADKFLIAGIILVAIAVGLLFFLWKKSKSNQS